MKILVINSGSSSIKSALFNSKKQLTEIARTHIDGLGLKTCKLILKIGDKIAEKQIKITNHQDGIKLILQTFLKHRLIKNFDEIKAAGHRVVHGGEKYTKSIFIDNKVFNAIKKLNNLAPLHNPANLASIKACKNLLPKAKQIAVFDTAFHQTMPEKAYLYGLPYEFYKRHQIRRFGFHGTSHKFVVNEAIKIFRKKYPVIKSPKIISCHLGNGSSITASIAGKCLDTSMGFTPMEGVIMGTRSGSIDPGIILHLEKNLKMTTKKIDQLLNHKSGLKGLSGISSDMRDIYKKSLKGDKPAKLAIEILSYQIAKYCGSYAAAMSGIDAIIFTGGIGEHASYIRDKVHSYLEFLKIKNFFIIPTDEEKQIAIETENLLLPQ